MEFIVLKKKGEKTNQTNIKKKKDKKKDKN